MEIFPGENYLLCNTNKCSVERALYTIGLKTVVDLKLPVMQY